MNNFNRTRLFAVLSVFILIVGIVPPQRAVQGQTTLITIDGVRNSALFSTSPWYLRGRFNGWGTDLPMVDDGTNGDSAAGDGIYTAVTVPADAGQYEFKVASEDWASSYPSSNSWLETTAASQAVTVTFDTNTHTDGWQPASNIIGVSTEPGTWTAVGDWQGWANDNPDTRLIDQGGGLYSLTAPIPTPGSYSYKMVKTGSWNAVGADGRSIDAANASFTTTTAGQKVTFTVDALAGRIQAVPETAAPTPAHDNNIWWDGLGHNSRSDLYRVPFGAVTTGVPVILRFRTFHNDVTSVTLRLWSTASNSQTLLPMQLVASSDDPPYGYDYWQVTLPAQQTPTVLWYRFIVRDGSQEVYYEDDSLRDGGWGQTFDASPDNSWQIDVYEPDFQTPDWMQNAVIYQIFPDRFFNGKTNNDAKPGDPSVYGNPVVKQDWTALPEGYCRAYVNPATPCDQQALGRDFFGGDLKGVRQKLEYLKSLGVTAIYFNPIFMAPSNHLYDTTDYTSIDPYFGNYGDFASLVDNANQLGIHLILDGVFNHTSSDSLYFDKYSRYKTTGAYESQSSIYSLWYTFLHWPETYNSWFGFDSLPVLTEVPAVRSFIYGSDNSIARRWIKAGSSGWRLDVAPDKSHDWWQEFRPQVKSVNPNAVIIGEIWDDASDWLLGDQFDSTMNYRFRRAMLGFVNGSFSDPNQGDITGLNPDQFNSAMQSIKEDYPAPAYAAMMNLVDSHDTQRILWALTPGQRNREDKELNAANVAEGKSKLKLLAVMQMTMPGAPTIYYGDEAGLTGDTDPDDRRAFPWNNIDNDLLSHYQTLTGLRNQYSFLRTGSYDRLFTNNDDSTYAYGRKDTSGAALVAVNNSTSTRTLTIDLSGYIPDGTTLTDALTGQTAQVTGGMLTITLDVRQGAVFITPAGTDLSAPTAPANLTASAASGRVDLNWQSVPDAASYNIYRSLVTEGGYTRLNEQPITGESYADSSVTNGQWYYYVVTAVDGAGNESARLNEAAALPHDIIGWANLQYPSTIDHTISAVNATPDIYGQVWIEGVTNLPGAAAGLIAQVGYGPRNSDPASSSGWIWTDTHFNNDVGNNDEYAGSLLPETTGQFDYAYRYSTTGGTEWVYADLDGIGNGYDPAQAGKMTVSPSGDSTPPAAPANLHTIEAASSFIHFGWDAVSDADLYGYEVFRADASGGPYTRLARLQAPAADYTDWDVLVNSTYNYVVTALDTSFNRSGYSNELAVTATPRDMQVTFNVTVPDSTGSDTVYIAGSFQGWDPGATAMTQVDSTHWTITLTLKEGDAVEYKYTLGSWDSVEKGASCEELNNRKLTVLYGTDGTQVQADTVANWHGKGSCPL